MLPRLLAALLALACSFGSAAESAKGAPPPPPFSPGSDAQPGGFPTAPEGAVDGQPKASVQEFLEKQGPAIDSLAPPLSPEWTRALDGMVASGDYERVEKLSRREFRDSPSFTEWISARAQSVDVRLMWTLAERYAVTRRSELAARWAYAALLGTQQESATCIDNESRVAANLLTESHPDLMKAIRQQPFSIKEAKEFAFALLARAPRYADPQLWLCRPYASETTRGSTTRAFVYDPIYHPYLRARERNKLRALWRVSGPPEPVPAMPQPGQGAQGAAPR